MEALDERLTSASLVASRRQTGPIPVLFIAGSARSGSTLVDRVIGMQDGFCSTGELQFIWGRSFGENQLCGCGMPFHDCPFWRRVTDRAFGVVPSRVDQEAAARLKASVDRKDHIPALLSRRAPRPDSDLFAYGELLQRLYGAILDVSQARVIIDSSKDPRHGLALARLRSFQVHVVHLVRDPRAVAFSWTRVRNRPEIHWKDEDMMTQGAWSSAARWTTHNAVVELLGAAASSYCRVRYEDFVANPDATLSRILAPYEWSGETPRTALDGAPALDGARASANGRQVQLEPTHSVSGNPMRFQTGPLRIKLDDEWRTALPAPDRLAVEAATWPLMARYGYSLRAAREPGRSRGLSSSAA